jgi:hypothetical protein
MICDPIDFDSVVFQCWLDGLPAGKALALKITGCPSNRVGPGSAKNVDTLASVTRG